MILLGTDGKRQQAVELGNQAGIHLDRRSKLGKSHHQFVEKSRFQRKNPVLCTHNLLLVLLQFLRDVALCLRQRLLANPLGRYHILIGVSYLQIITEHIIVTYLQALNARCLYLALLDVQQVIFSLISNTTQFVEFVVYAFCYHISLIHHQWRIRLNFFGYAVANAGA